METLGSRESVSVCTAKNWLGRTDSLRLFVVLSQHKLPTSLRGRSCFPQASFPGLPSQSRPRWLFSWPWLPKVSPHPRQAPCIRIFCKLQSCCGRLTARSLWHGVPPDICASFGRSSPGPSLSLHLHREGGLTISMSSASQSIRPGPRMFCSFFG